MRTTTSLTNEQVMNKFLSRHDRGMLFNVSGEEYHIIKAVYLAKKLGIDRLTASNRNGITLNVEIAHRNIRNVFSQRTTYSIEEHDRSRTEWVKCKDCGEWHHKDDMNDVDGESVCESCYDQYSTCESCDRQVHGDDCVWTADTNNSSAVCLCESCADNETQTCYECSNVCLEDDMIQIANGEYVCGDCRDDYYRCEGCGSYYHMDYIHSDRNDDMYCENCEGDEESDSLHSYSYKPSPDFYGDANHFYGIEIECEPRGTVYDLAQRVAPIMYLKEDSSLNSDGVEIVSHPMSYDYIHNQLDWGFLEDVRGWINDYGVHLHVCRKAFNNQFHIEKVANFFAIEPEFIDKIAQRNSERWAKVQRKKGISKKRDRYRAINQTCSNTIEFRMFQSSCRKDRVLKNIQFIEAVIEYTRQPLLISDMSIKDFYKYVDTNNYIYPDLYLFMEEITEGTNSMKR